MVNIILGGLKMFYWYDTLRFETLSTSEITSDDDNFYVTIDVPGFTKDDIDVSVVNDELIITGKKNINSNNRTIDRKFKLNNSVEISTIHATVSHGVLTITLSKDKMQSKRYKIKVY